MAKSGQNDESADLRLTDAEIVALRSRLRPEDGGRKDVREHGANTLRDIAEATGMPVEAVRDHLKRYRAEQAFGPRDTHRKIPWVPVLVVAAVLFGGYGVWRRVNPEAQASTPTSGREPTRANFTMSPQRKPGGTSLSTTFIQWGPGAAPPGFRVAVIGQASSYVGDGLSLAGRVPPLDYDWARARLADATAALVKMTLAEDKERPHIAGPFRDMASNLVTPRPGHAHYSLIGPRNTIDGWVKAPVDEAGRRHLLEDATRFLAETKQTQDAAMDVAVDPAKGTVKPPPGFRVEFTGRRSDTQSGPTLVFSGMDPDLVRQRLELALRNAMERDRRPPEGRWNEGDDSKIPVPAMSHVQINGPFQSRSFELPTSKGWGPDAQKAIRAGAAFAADDIRLLNQRSREFMHATQQH